MADLLRLIKRNKNIFLNVYIVGKNSDQAIKDWAKKNNIPSMDVLTGRITLNHDERRLKKMISKDVELPFLIQEKNAKAYPVALNSI